MRTWFVVVVPAVLAMFACEDVVVCDSGHPCPGGSTCQENRCVPVDRGADGAGSPSDLGADATANLRDLGADARAVLPDGGDTSVRFPETSVVDAADLDSGRPDLAVGPDAEQNPDSGPNPWPDLGPAVDARFVPDMRPDFGLGTDLGFHSDMRPDLGPGTDMGALADTMSDLRIAMDGGSPPDAGRSGPFRLRAASALGGGGRLQGRTYRMLLLGGEPAGGRTLRGNTYRIRAGLVGIARH